MSLDRQCREFLAVGAGAIIAAVVFFAGLPELCSMAIAFAFMAGMVAWIGWQDLCDLTIPDGPLLAMAIVGTAQRLSGAGVDLPSEAISAGIDALVCGGVLLLLREIYFRLRGVEGLGFGDVKLAAAAGAFIGYIGFAWAVMIASIAGLLVVFISSIVKPHRQFDRIAFGAFLAPVCWVVRIFEFNLVQ